MTPSRPINFGVFAPQGWRMDLVEIADPIEKYETMTRVAQAADCAGYDSIWVFDHFHTVPTPEMERPSSAGRSQPGWPATPSGSRLGRW